MDKTPIIIVHVNEKYLDLADIFFEMLKRNFGDCPYKIVVSYKGKIPIDYGCDVYNSSESSGLANDVYTIMKQYRAQYAISLLGDAFFVSKLKMKKIATVIDYLINNSVDYCRLYHSKNNIRELSPIKITQIYGVSFIAFFVSFTFAKRELKALTDLDFEKKYLKIAIIGQGDSFSNYKMYALPNSIFGIMHGVGKGRWLPDTYHVISLQLGKKAMGNRVVMGKKEYFWVRSKVLIRNSILGRVFYKFIFKVKIEVGHFKERRRKL